MMKSAWLYAMLLAVAGTGAVAHAQTLPTLPPPPAPASTIHTLSAHLVARLYAEPGPARVELVVTATPQAKPEAAAFVANALEAELRRRQPQLVRVLPGAAPGLSGPDERLEVTLAIKDGQLTATALRRALPGSIWEALAHREGRVLATAFAAAAVDLEVRALFSLGRREVRVDRARLFQVSKKSSPAALSGRLLDCAVADADNDQQPELLLVGPDRVHALRWQDGGFSVELGGFDLSSLAPNEARLREPLGKVVPIVRGDGTTVVVAASSDRAEPVALVLTQGGLTRSGLTFQRGWPLYATGVDSLVIAPWPQGLDLLEGGLTEARLGSSAAAWLGGASRVHDVRGAHVAGRPTLLAAGLGGRLLVGTPAPLASHGALGVAALVTDLDADGALELVTTSANLNGPDKVSIATLGRKLQPLWASAVPAPVTAMCAGDVDRDGFEEIIVATHNGQSADLFLVVPR